MRLIQKRCGHDLLKRIGRREERGARTHITWGRCRVFGIHSGTNLLSENEKRPTEVVRKGHCSAGLMSSGKAAEYGERSPGGEMEIIGNPAG